MFKAIALIKKKRDMPMQEFIDYYENNHAPLAVSKLPNLVKYVRHYLRSYGNDVYAKDNEAPYDVLTEIWFENEVEFAKGMAKLTEPETAAIIAADEDRLFERSSIRFMVMQDCETALPAAR
jgi:uncharacterized protein (TIGR02118 family)